MDGETSCCTRSRTRNEKSRSTQDKGVCCTRKTENGDGDEDSRNQRDNTTDVICRAIFCISTAINVILIIGLITLFVVHAMDTCSECDEADYMKSPSVCILCGEGGGEVLVDYRVTTSQGSRMCCYNKTGIQDLIYSVYTYLLINVIMLYTNTMTCLGFLNSC